MCFIDLLQNMHTNRYNKPSDVRSLPVKKQVRTNPLHGNICGCTYPLPGSSSSSLTVRTSQTRSSAKSQFSVHLQLLATYLCYIVDPDTTMCFSPCSQHLQNLLLRSASSFSHPVSIIVASNCSNMTQIRFAQWYFKLLYKKI